MGPQGPIGVTGDTGATGATGSGVAALFYAMVSADVTVPGFGAIDFPSHGANTDTLSIFRQGNSPSEFVLAQAGVYRVSVQVSVTEAAQLVLAFNGAHQLITTVGNETGSSQLTMVTLMATATPGTILSVRNAGSTDITVTDTAGGANPVSATLLIELVKADPIVIG
jgi:hypothetical protein